MHVFVKYLLSIFFFFNKIKKICKVSVSPLDKPFVLLGQTHYVINKICLYKKKNKKKKIDQSAAQAF